MSGMFVGMPAFPEASRAAVADPSLRANLARATGGIRARRAAAVGEVPHWRQLTSAGARLKDHALTSLPERLEELERNLVANGVRVHWARDGEEASEVVARVAREAGVDEVVKVKSMTTAEIDLNERLREHGIAAWETDLAELIVQLGDDLPSHILVPAIHRNRSEIRDIFTSRMHEVGHPAPIGLTDTPADLAEAARVHLRERFLRAQMAVSGVNFAVAETGSLVVVESEGNGRMCLTLPRVLVSVVGVDKVIAGWDDLGVFLQLLPRSATGERMNPYTSIWSGPVVGDGPEEVHVVLLDNGRSRALADDTGRQALRCIRCSACLNVCPVYERTGGHAYGSVYPGPIGAILNPLLAGPGSTDVIDALPFASSLCGACGDVCPVEIDIPGVLVSLREQTSRVRPGPAGDAGMRITAWVLRSPRRMAVAQRLARGVGSVLSTRSPAGGRRLRRLPGPGRAWTRSRDLPLPARRSFTRQWNGRDR